MKRYILITLLFTALTLHTTTYTVSLDGTADFTSIQSAINFSTNGDVIKVFPARYYENINYYGKNVTVTSLFSYTNDRNDIYNTIIDGNQNSSCVIFWNNENRNAILNGFTLENGIGKVQDNPSYAGYMEHRTGGGISIADASPCILNCIIQNNRVSCGYGGGILISGSLNNYNPFLSGNVIKNNYSNHEGGGIYMGYRTIVTFDPVNKNSIFLNRGGIGHDIFAINMTVYIDVPLDTFTVANEDPVFVAIYNENHNFYFEHHIIDNFINSDLYVSTSGNDVVNDGLSPATPFKTLSHALYWIASDPTNPKTVHVAPGTYSPSNGQIFPTQMKSYVTLSGAGPDLTIFDGEHIYDSVFFTSVFGCEVYKISGICFIKTIHLLEHQIDTRQVGTPMRLEGVSGLEISDCNFKNNIGSIANYYYNYRFMPYNVNSEIKLQTLCFDSNINASISLDTYKTYFSNTIFRNHSYYGSGNLHRGNPPIILFGWANRDQIHQFSNLLIYNNESYLDYDWNGIHSNAIMLGRNMDVLINNATIAGNTLNAGIAGGPILLDESGSNVHIYNSIIYGNSPNNIYSLYGSNTVSVHNTLLQGGQSSIINAQTTWGEGNLNTDPLLVNPNHSIHPYALSNASPAINAGTLDIDFPDYVLPTTDIIGNPRVAGGAIDMGAYEFQGLLADFIATPTSGLIPLTVQFSDRSTGPVFAWQWFVVGEDAPFSIEQNPSYTFTIPGTYSIRLEINGGERELIRHAYIDVQPDSDNDFTLPVITDLTPPYPNPFRSRTMLKMTVNEDGKVAMNIYNIKGQKVRTLLNERKDVGIYQIVWDGKNDKGVSVASGIYTIEVKHGNKKVGVTKVSYIK